LTPAVPTALTGLWAYGEQASLPVLVLLVLAVYVVSLLASIPVTGAISRWRADSERQLGAPQTERGAAPNRASVVQTGSIGNIGHVENLHIVAAPQQTDVQQEHKPDAEAEPDYENRQRFEDENVHLSVFPLVLDHDIYIRGRIFKNCRIYGPAVVVPTKPSTYEDTFLSNCTFYGEPDAILWPATEERSGYLGVLAFEGCVFDGCDFFRVGILVKEQNYPVWLERWREERRELEEDSDRMPELEPSDEEPTSQ